MESGESGSGWLRPLWGRATARAWHKAVRELARAHFADYGYRGERVERDGAEVVVDTEHCRVHFYEDKGGLGAYIRPMVDGSYVIQYVDEVPVPEDLPLVYAAVQRQMRAIVERYGLALKGDFADWPTT